jgi:hypothetical protein
MKTPSFRYPARISTTRRPNPCSLNLSLIANWPTSVAGTSGYFGSSLMISSGIRSVFRMPSIVLHVFQKKSTKAIPTPTREIELIKQRLAEAERDYRERQN